MENHVLPKGSAAIEGVRDIWLLILNCGISPVNLIISSCCHPSGT